MDLLSALPPPSHLTLNSLQVHWEPVSAFYVSDVAQGRPRRVAQMLPAYVGQVRALFRLVFHPSATCVVSVWIN